MPPGAVLSEEDAIERWINGERSYMQGEFEGETWDLSEFVLRGSTTGPRRKTGPSASRAKVNLILSCTLKPNARNIQLLFLSKRVDTYPLR